MVEFGNFLEPKLFLANFLEGEGCPRILSQHLWPKPNFLEAKLFLPNCLEGEGCPRQLETANIAKNASLQ